MFSRFFIDRPIFAAVLSVVITLAGGIAVWTLPIAQYPQITPPSIVVSTTYPGANAQTVAESVAAPIEQQVNGVENMFYMSSQCANDGSYSLTVTFKPGVNLNFAQVLVQNRINLALPQLPEIVKQIGVVTRKRNPDILLVVNLISPDNRFDQLHLSNYAAIHLKDEVSRVDGVGDVFLFGQQDYSMRVWVDPDQLAARNLTAMDVVAAIREQNQQVAAGQIGQPPISHPQESQFTLTTLGRLTEPEQFADIILRTTKEGRVLRIKDIGHVELSAKTLDIENKLDSMPSTGVAVFQLPDANALDTADRIKAKMEELKKAFPPGLEYKIVYDTTPFVRESVDEVFKTLGEAIILVALVVLIFLQSWRSTIIPLVAVPVAIIGTFAVMAAVGFSLNNLTLFGLVLAIGIVVDDAIVVVEAVEHHIEEGLLPKQAAIKAMEQVSGPVIAVALVLTAVFVPCMFISGITGQFFRQFALTIAVSTIISALNSLTLSPALAALFLKPKGAKRDLPGRVLFFLLGWFFWLFNFAFRHSTNAYARAVGLMLRGSAVVLVLYVALLGLTYWGFNALPAGYIPPQDKGYLSISVQLPDAASLERTKVVMDQIDEICKETPGVDHRITIAGQSFTLGAFGSNFGQFFIMLKPFDERRDPKLYSTFIAANLSKRIEAEIPDARAFVSGPPPVAGLGSGGGFTFIVEDRGVNDLKTLQQQTDNLVAKARDNPRLRKEAISTIFTVKSPQKYVDVNRQQCEALGVAPGDVFSTLQIYLGSLYVNDFNLGGRTWQVNVQAEGQFRSQVEDVKRLKVRNRAGGMIPLGTVMNIEDVAGPLILTRYNEYPAAAIRGDTAPGVSSGEAIHIMEDLANQELPRNMAFEWTEITYVQLQSGNTAMLLFALGVLAVFLVLAALYESWALPLAVILVVPMCLLSSIAGVAITHSDINIFTQIGFVVLVGLACKNAILIVEFAKLKRDAGLSRRDATLEAIRLRLRPILMTSFAFILGVVPLAFSQGAGAEMRRTLGVAVFSGMLGVTLFGIFLTPVFFYVVEWVSEMSLFNHPWVKRFHDVSLDVLTLRFVPRLAHEYWNSRPVAARSGLNGTAGADGDAASKNGPATPSSDAGIQAKPK
ncbi:MAG TPA: transporter [Planctomycetales bacterium]|nr:transporter [Planctomycetales bacterium]